MSKHDKDINMLHNPYQWPNYPVLPMVRRSPGQPPECAVVIAGEGTLLYRVNMFELVGEKDEDLIIAKYMSFDEMLADRWEVD